MVIYFSLLVSIVGLVTYAISDNPGDVMFWVGLLAFQLTGVPHLVSVVR